MARAIPLPTAWEKPVKTWLASLHARGLSPTTIALYRAHVSQMARGIDCPPEQVTGTILENWCASREWAVETRRSAYLAYTQFFTNYAERTGRKNPAAILVPPGPPPREPRPAPEEAITEGLAEASPRVKLMIRLGAMLGLRIGEIVRIHRNDIEEEMGGPILRVLGKGNKKRSVPLTPDLADELRAWADKGDGWVFPSQRGDHLQPHSGSQLLSAALPGKWTAHTLRHRFATMAYEVDRDILVIQRLLGHSSVATTMRYARPPRQAFINAMQGAALAAPRN